MSLWGTFGALVIGSLLVSVLGACTPTMPVPAAQGKAGGISPSWSASAYRNQDRDDAWHFAYAVQSWAAEQSGHIVMIPTRHAIVVDRAFFSEEFSHVPVRAFPGIRSDDPNRVMVLRHMWTTHASSWDYDTDIKFGLYGPGFIKEGSRAGEATPANHGADLRQPDGHSPPKGIDGTGDDRGPGTDVEAAPGDPHDRDGRGRPVALRGVAGRVAPDQGTGGAGG